MVRWAGMTIPQGRLRRTAPLAALSARAAAEGLVDVLRRRLKGERGASLEFHVRNAERYADVLSRSKGVLMKVGEILSFVYTSALLAGPAPAGYCGRGGRRGSSLGTWRARPTRSSPSSPPTPSLPRPSGRCTRRACTTA